MVYSVVEVMNRANHGRWNKPRASCFSHSHILRLSAHGQKDEVAQQASFTVQLLLQTERAIHCIKGYLISGSRSTWTHVIRITEKASLDIDA